MDLQPRRKQLIIELVMSFWNAAERRLFRRLSSPFRIQQFLNSLKYNVDEFTRSPRLVIQAQRAHCLDGAIFAAAALEELGDPPLVIDLRANLEDDDHVVAVFRRRGLWGAVAQSDFTGLRFRDPVYRSLRELAMSYFNVYFNLAGRRTLREFSLSFDLRRIKDIDWRRGEDDLTALSDRLDRVRHFRLITRPMEQELSDADDRLFRAETLGLDPKGAFKVKGARIS